MLVLRPYQRAAADAVRAHVRGGAKSVLVQSPTGTGKTCIGLDFALGAIAKGGQVVWLAPRRELVAQAAQGLLRSGHRDIGVLLAGASRGSPTAPIQVASVQTLFARDVRPTARVVIWDEAHHCTAATYRSVADAYPDAWHIGLTATPERSDRTALGNVFERLVIAIGMRDAVGEKFLVPCVVRAPNKFLEDGIAGNAVQQWLEHANGAPTVAFAGSVLAAHDMAKAFRAVGVPAAVIDGTTPTAERAETLAAFAAGRLRVLTNVFCLTEGWDCPSAAVCLIARGCSSAGMFLQMVGRVLRPAPGKTSALLIDMRGVVHLHGLPCDDRVFSLDGRPIRQLAGIVSLRQCPACGATFRAERECPACGAVAPLREPPKTRTEKLEDIRSVATPQQKASAYARMRAFARWKGHAEGSAAHRFKAVYGHWPNMAPINLLKGAAE